MFLHDNAKINKVKNIDQNEIEYMLTEDIISFGIPVINAMMNLSLDTYENDRRIFKKELAKLNINHGYQGYNQMILCLVIIKHFIGDELIFVRKCSSACITHHEGES